MCRRCSATRIASAFPSRAATSIAARARRNSAAGMSSAISSRAASSRSQTIVRWTKPWKSAALRRARFPSPKRATANSISSATTRASSTGLVWKTSIPRRSNRAQSRTRRRRPLCRGASRGRLPRTAGFARISMTRHGRSRPPVSARRIHPARSTAPNGGRAICGCAAISRCRKLRAHASSSFALRIHHERRRIYLNGWNSRLPRWTGYIDVPLTRKRCALRRTQRARRSLPSKQRRPVSTVASSNTCAPGRGPSRSSRQAQAHSNLNRQRRRIHVTSRTEFVRST